MNSFLEEEKISESIQMSANSSSYVSQVQHQFQQIKIGKEIQQKPKVAPMKNKQDQQLRNYRGDINKFLKHGRGWFPQKLPYRVDKLLYKQSPQDGQTKPTKNCLRIMSYNVLATTLTNEFEYGTDPEYIKWENRFPEIKKEITFLQPDILCLQETEEHTGLHEFLTQELKFEGEFFKKQDATKTDGCGTFYNPQKYVLVQKFGIPFNFNSDSDLYFKPNCCLILALQPIDHPQKLFLVSNTHIYFNVNRGDTKLAQLKMMTDALAILKSYYIEVQKKPEVSVFVCGDFNSAPRSGMYDFMREGFYDCLKLNRNEISGQYRGMFSFGDKIAANLLHSSTYNMDQIPTDKPASDQGRICEWFTEITHTYPDLQFDDNMQAVGFVPRTSVPFSQISMKQKRPKSVQCQEYLRMVEKYVETKKQEGENIHSIITDPDRSFFKLMNNCGKFKSAYAQNMLNHLQYINQIKNDTFPLDYLDKYSKEPEDYILEELIAEGGGNQKSGPLGYYNQEWEEIYGAFKWHSHSTHTREWLKRMSILTKEPCYTSYTNIKLCVDYIFYQGEGINVARVLDLPSFSRYMKENIECLPQPMMPSDHFSILADFIIQ